jgi:hypothetical protein
MVFLSPKFLLSPNSSRSKKFRSARVAFFSVPERLGLMEEVLSLHCNVYMK